MKSAMHAGGSTRRTRSEELVRRTSTHVRRAHAVDRHIRADEAHFFFFFAGTCTCIAWTDGNCTSSRYFPRTSLALVLSGRRICIACS
jgi:hypothetical protein